jgi:hypothetical protein
LKIKKKNLILLEIEKLKNEKKFNELKISKLKTDPSLFYSSELAYIKKNYIFFNNYNNDLLKNFRYFKNCKKYVKNSSLFLKKRFHIYLKKSFNKKIMKILLKKNKILLKNYGLNITIKNLNKYSLKKNKKLFKIKLDLKKFLKLIKFLKKFNIAKRRKYINRIFLN